MSACCDAAGDGRVPSQVRSARGLFAWILPSAMLVLMPKCPVCLAAHVTLWTGLGLSLTAAFYLRWGLLLLCLVALLLLMVKRLHCAMAIVHYFKQETEPCHTR